MNTSYNNGEDWVKLNLASDSVYFLVTIKLITNVFYNIFISQNTQVSATVDLFYSA